MGTGTTFTKAVKSETAATSTDAVEKQKWMEFVREIVRDPRVAKAREQMEADQ